MILVETELVMKLINNYVYKNPILGNGIDFAISQRAHNTVIGAWADAGIFTFIFFLFMLGNYFINAIASLQIFGFLLSLSL